jgi:hypothetical protein
MSAALIGVTDHRHHLACTYWASFSYFSDYSGLLPIYLWLNSHNGTIKRVIPTDMAFTGLYP